MYDEGVVIGKVVGRENGGPKSEYLLVEDKSRPEYPNTVAAECYGDRNRALLSKVGMGDLVRVVGSIRSFKSKETGRWFTTFSVFSVTNLSNPDSKHTWAPAPQQAPLPGIAKPRDRVPGEDDDDVTGDHPF